MKLLIFFILIGTVMLYFINIAILKTPILDYDWSIHASLRFFVGFFILGISCFYTNAVNFKKAIYITAGIVIADYIYDYYVQAYRLKLEIILHGIFMIVWGAVLGYLTARYIKGKK